MSIKRVLIVEDSIELGRMLQDALRTAHPGIHVTLVPSAEEAFLESTRLTIDLLVSDIRLPGISGLDLIRKFRVKQPDVKVIVISGLVIEGELQKQVEAIRADALMHKPMRMAEFLDIALAMLGFEVGPPSPEAPTIPINVTEKKDSQPQPVEKADGLAPQEQPAFSNPDRLKTQLPQVGEEGENLSVVLSKLRGSLGAFASLLLDDVGHVMAQAGDLPEPGLLDKLVPSMMAALSAGAKVSAVIGLNAGAVVQAYRGEHFDLVIAPVGQYVLALAVKPGPSQLRMALAFEEALTAQVELAEALKAMGLRVQPLTETAAPELNLGTSPSPDEEKDDALAALLEAPTEATPGFEKLEELFIQEDAPALMVEDIDAFWEEASAASGTEPSSPGMLTYDQAQKLGLISDDEGEDS